jgi:hypothetical protein
MTHPFDASCRALSPCIKNPARPYMSLLGSGVNRRVPEFDVCKKIDVIPAPPIFTDIQQPTPSRADIRRPLYR